MSDRKWFKAQSAAERSGNILVSFDARWRDSMSSGRIHYVLRRRYPKSFRPHRMYLYIGSPHSQLVGFTSINEVRPINFKEGLRILVASGLTRRELASYFSGYEKVGCYVISSVAVFKQPLALETLRARSGFVPPQSFVALSERASKWLAQQELVQPARDALVHNSRSRSIIALHPEIRGPA